MKKMKKILVLFIILAAANLVNVKATTFTSKFIGTYHFVDQNGKWGDFEMFYRTDNHRVAYCIEPGASLSSEEYIEYGNITTAEMASHLGISEDLLRTIAKYAFYGYGYTGHTSNEWLIATQVKIWSLVGREVQFTSQNNPSNPWAYVIDMPLEIKEKIEELERLVNEYPEVPQIKNNHYELSVGETLELQDAALANYKLTSSTDDVKLEGTTLTIAPSKETAYTQIVLELKNKIFWPRDMVVYYHSTGQDLLQPGRVDHTIKLSYEATSGRVKLIKYDEDTKQCSSKGKATLENAIYGIYKEDGSLVETLTIKNCEAISSNLPLGSYYLKEIESPYGYELDIKEYPFTLSKDQKEITITAYDKQKKIKLSLNKQYLEEKELTLPEEGAIFNVISKTTNKVVTTLKTDKKGNAWVTLPYDEYELVQVKGKENYILSETTEFVIDDRTTDEVKISLVNEPYTKKIRLIKKDATTGKRIYLANIEFKIYDTVRNKYVCENPSCTFKTNEYGEFTTNELFPSTYVIEEVKNKIKGYLWNETKITVTVNQNSEDIILVEFKNKPVRGELTIYKANEDHLTLEGVEFELYAKEAIFDSEHKLLYAKDELIKKAKTDEFGKIVFDYLPLGKYYIKEKKPLEGYVIDERAIDMELFYMDEETEIVTNEILLINYKVPQTYQNGVAIMPTIPIACWLGERKNEKNNCHTVNTFN